MRHGKFLVNVVFTVNAPNEWDFIAFLVTFQGQLCVLVLPECVWPAKHVQPYTGTR